MRIMQSMKNLSKFKIFIHLPFKPEDIIPIFLEIETMRKWNNQISELKLLQVIEEKTAFIYEKRKNLNWTYFPREFIYLRSAFIKDNAFFIVDKSAEYNNLKKKFSVIRGNIFKSIISISEHPKNRHLSLIACEIEIVNNGYLNWKMEKNLTVAYLSEFINIEPFIGQLSFYKKKIPKFSIELTNLNLKKDLNDVNSSEEIEFNVKIIKNSYIFLIFCLYKH